MRVIQKLKIQNRWEGREISAVKVAILSGLQYFHFNLFLHLKKHLDGQKIDDDGVKNKVTMWLHAQAAELYGTGI
jgi:hypothetical protein